jgi:hypothetical protein
VIAAASKSKIGSLFDKLDSNLKKFEIKKALIEKEFYSSSGW